MRYKGKVITCAEQAILALLLTFSVGCAAAPTPTPAASRIAPSLTPEPIPSAPMSTLTPSAQVTNTETMVSTTGTAPTVSPSPEAVATSTPGATSPAATPPRLAGYFFGSDRNNHVSDIAAAQLGDVLYAFADVTRAGECASISQSESSDEANFGQLRGLKQQHPSLGTLISIGGYSHSTYFSDAAATPGSRSHFVQSCIRFMQQNGFDGIDVDWELPVSGGQPGNIHRPQDKQNFTALLVEFRSELDTLGAGDGRHYLLTIAGPAGPSEYSNIELGVISRYLDWINVETYAFYTAGSPVTNFNAPLYPSSTDPNTNQQKRLYNNGDAAVRAYLAAGVPANKILLGVPFYGRGWRGVPNANNGLYQTDTGAATDAGVPKGVWSDGAILYGDLQKYYLGSYARYWQDEAKEPWLYNPTTGIMITYEDSQSLKAKADYVRAQNLGGLMIWHLSADDAQHSLLGALFALTAP